MGVEFFAASALAGFPDRHVAGVEDVDFLAPFKFYRSEPRRLTVEVSYTSEGDDIIGTCRLVGVRTLANQDEPQRTVHFTGRVRLAGEEPSLGAGSVPSSSQNTVTSDDIYEIYFHGPAYQVVESAWMDGDAVAALMAEDLPLNHKPADQELTTTPRLTELAFQTAGIWEIGTTGAMALPFHIDRIVYATASAGSAGSMYAVVRPGVDGGFDATIVDDQGAVRVAMFGYRTVRLPGSIDAAAVAPLKKAMTNGG